MGEAGYGVCVCHDQKVDGQHLENNELVLCVCYISPHFRAATLRQIGGWDPYNVTEDADLGFRLGAAGHRIGVIEPPTLEDAPLRFEHWLPQRTRWVKGYMQTWGVHMRRPFAGGIGVFVSLQTTLGMAILGAALHGPLFLVLAGVLVGNGLLRTASPWLPADLSVFALGWSTAALANAVGAQRAGLKVGLTDVALSLAYWPLQSLAFILAARQLVTAPHYWAKTPHVPTQGRTKAPSQPLDADTPWSVSPAA